MTERTVSVRMDLQGKNLLVAYLLWWFLGWLGVHRFYLGRPGSGIAQLLLVVIGGITAFVLFGFVLLAIWFVWWALDAYFVYKIVEEENRKLGITHPTISWSQSGTVQNELDQLEKLHSLYEKGVLTQEQYEGRRDALLKAGSTPR